jgi:hypothetical protein
VRYTRVGINARGEMVETAELLRPILELLPALDIAILKV